MCRGSSVVERVIGNDEAGSSILPRGTIYKVFYYNSYSKFCWVLLVMPTQERFSTMTTILRGIVNKTHKSVFFKFQGFGWLLSFAFYLQFQGLGLYVLGDHLVQVYEEKLLVYLRFLLPN